ncbi:MAG: nucleoside-triphosphatase [Candidatus Bathyarchaeota archaeon]|nr:nucleoside-triphosphatase [Candidatus Bathyarchaeota archaeon]
MSKAIIIHGAIGAGKTKTCLELVHKAKDWGIRVEGVISPRVFEGESLIGYDCRQVSSGEAFPLVRLKEYAVGLDWFHFGGMMYAFSTGGFERANNILMRASIEMTPSTLIFVDEFGRLEDKGRGLHSGVSAVASKLTEGVAVLTCRSDLVESVCDLLGRGASDAVVLDAGEAGSAWEIVRATLG